MKVIVKGRHMEVTKALKDYAESRFSRIPKAFTEKITKAEAELFVEKNPSIRKSSVAEFMIVIRGSIIRAKSSSEDMYSAIDFAIEKLVKQLEKFKGKTYASNNKHAENLVEAIIHNELIEKNGSAKGKRQKTAIYKRKTFTVKPMSLEEAVSQMEVLGHDFFLFVNNETEEMSLVYRRRDNGYGVIEAIVEE